MIDRGEHLEVVAGVAEDDRLVAPDPEPLQKPRERGAFVPSCGHDVGELRLRDVEIQTVDLAVEQRHDLARALKVAADKDVCLRDARRRNVVTVDAGLAIAGEAYEQIVTGALHETRSLTLEEEQARGVHV